MSSRRRQQQPTDTASDAASDATPVRQLKRNLARAQMANGNARGVRTDSKSRLRFLLSLLLATTLLLILMQGFRAFRSSSGLRTRGLFSPRSSSVARGEETDPLSWKRYIATMQQHFKEQLQKTSNEKSAGTTTSEGGIAIVPGQDVQDHPVDKQSASAGKDSEKDRQAALEELDPETLRLMYEVLYGRMGGRVV